MGDTITVVKGDDVREVPADEAGHLVAKGYKIETGEQSAERVAAQQREEKYGGARGKFLAGAAGLARGATLGLSDVALSPFDTGNLFQHVAEENPTISTATNIAGAIAPILLSGGTAAPETLAGYGSRLAAASPTAITARIGSKIAGLGEGAGFVGKTAAIAGGAATEGALQNAGGYISDVALGNRDLSVDGFLASMGKGALYGGVAGGALSVASHGLIAARKLFPIEDVSPASVARAETEARQAVKGSVDTSTALERTGRSAVESTDRETEQFLRDLSEERKAAMDRAAQIRSAEEQRALPGVQGQRALGAGEAEAPGVARGSEPYSLSNAPSEQPGYGAAPAKSAEDLMAAWKQKHPEGAVSLDAASAAARKQRLRDWAEGFEAKTPEDETIKAYFSEPQDPMRTPVPKERLDAPKAVQNAANQAAAEASHAAYIEATAQGTNVSKSGTELMARATYAGRRAAARALDDVYTAYAAGQPIVDIRAAISKRLTDQLHELAAAREDMISSLSKGGDDLIAKLQATKSAVESGQSIKSLGQRILEGVKPQVDADAAVEAALGKSENVTADIAEVAPKITRYEAAKANLTEALGPDASLDARAHAKAFREAEAKASNANARNTATTVENVENATSRDIPADKLPGGNPRLGGFKKTLGQFGEVYEALHSFGLPMPGLHSIPIVGPVLSMFLKAKILGKVLRGHGGSFAATAEGTIAAKAAAVQNRVNAAVGSVLESGAAKVSAAAPAAGAVAALGFKLFDSGDTAKPYSSKPAEGDLQNLYADRLGELSAAMQPGAIDREVRARVNTSDPTLLDTIVAAETKRLQYLFNLAPKPNEQWPGQPAQSPSKQEIVDFGHVLNAFHDPAGTFEKVAAGDVARPSEIACVQNCYPQLYAAAVAKFVEKYSTGGATPSYQHQIAISMLYGVPMGPSMTPDYASFIRGPMPPVSMPPMAMGKPLPSSMGLGKRSLTRLDR